MTAAEVAEARSAPPRGAGPAADRGSAGLLRPHLPGFAALVVLQVIGALAGLAPLLAVAELGRTLLAAGPVDHGHVRTVVVWGAAGCWSGCCSRARRRRSGICSTAGCSSDSGGGSPRGSAASRSAGCPGAGPASWRNSPGKT